MDEVQGIDGERGATQGHPEQFEEEKSSASQAIACRCAGGQIHRLFGVTLAEGDMVHGAAATLPL